MNNEQWFVSKPTKIRAWRALKHSDKPIWVEEAIRDDKLRFFHHLGTHKVWDYKHKTWINFSDGDWIIPWN